MYSIDELEPACEPTQDAEPVRHMMDPPDMTHHATFYPFGFPAEVATNAPEVLEQYEEMWGRFEQQYDTEPLQVEVRLVEGGSAECPPEPTYRFMSPYMVCVADANNYSIAHLERGRINIVVSAATLENRLYGQYFILGTPAICVATMLTTPVHAGCVALNGRGVLLCGDSGAGKSTLAYACARAGWTYVTDDASFLLNGGSERRVSGDCYKVRFRPSARELFPEIAGLAITPRAAGKPSIELPTGKLPHMITGQSTRVDFIVFLNRHSGGAPQLAPYDKDLARRAMRAVLFGQQESRKHQCRALDHLLIADVYELRYTGLEWAVDRLRALALEGQ
jgi:hypothetical protein